MIAEEPNTDAVERKQEARGHWREDRDAHDASRALWVLNIALGAVIGLRYLDGFALGGSVRLWVFAHTGLVSTVATLSLAPAGVLWALRRARVRERTFEVAQAVAWTVFQLALLVDTRVWGLFRYHFNSAAWNLVTSKGSEDSYRLGPTVWLFAAGSAVSIALVNAVAWRVLRSRSRREIAQRRLTRPIAVALSVVALVVCVEKSIYARADLEHDRRLTAVSEAFPVYPRLRVRKMLPASVREQLDVLPEVVVALPDAQLAPPVEVRLPDDSPRRNVLLVVIDSWRGDMLDAQVTPHLDRFADQCRRFDDHLSTGNGTRFGVFGMLYGLHGSYWWPVLEAQRGPVLVDALDAAGYELRVLSAASMDYPEFRQCAWARWPDAVWDEFGDAPSSERDRRVAARFESWLDERDATQPFFAFVLLDSAHQKYDFPPEHALFTPYAKDVDYVELAGSRDPELVERIANRYRNALHHADEVAWRILEALRKRGELDDTLVIVTGDHGEEFAENGYWGHTGNFTREQVGTPLLLRGHGVTPGVERRPTSHIDIPGTLLELLGAHPSDVQRACFSRHLLWPLESRARVVAGWEEVGLWSGDVVFRIARDPTSGVGSLAVDPSWRPLVDQRAAFAAHAERLDDLSRECLQFLAPRDDASKW